MVKWDFLYFSLCLLPLVLSLGTMQKRLAPSLLCLQKNLPAATLICINNNLIITKSVYISITDFVVPKAPNSLPGSTSQSFLPWAPIPAVLPAHYICILAAAQVVSCAPMVLVTLD